MIHFYKLKKICVIVNTITTYGIKYFYEISQGFIDVFSDDSQPCLTA